MFNFKTLGRMIRSLVKKPGATQAEQAPAVQSNTVDSGPIAAKPRKSTRKAK